MLKILKNFAYLTVGRLCGDVAVFLFFVVLARSFGREGTGQYSFAMALTGALVVLADFGIFNYSVRGIAREVHDIAGYYGRLLSIRLGLVGVAGVILLIGAAIMPFSPQLKMIVILVGIYQIALTLVDGFGGVFVGREAMHIASLLEFSNRVTTAVAGVVVIWLHGGLVAAVATLPVITVLHIAVGYWVTVRYYGVALKPVDLEYVQVIMRGALPFAQRALLTLLASRIALLFVGFLVGEAAAGVFNGAYRIMFVLLFLPAFAGMAVFPVAARLHERGKAKLEQLFGETTALSLFVGIPMAVGIWLIAPDLIYLLYGPEFAPSATVLRWLGWMIPFAFLRSVMEVFLLATDREKVVTQRYLLAAVLSAATHYVATVRLGVAGAAAATLLIEMMLVLLLGYELRSMFTWRKIAARAAVGVTGASAFAVPFSLWKGLPLGVTITASTAIYCVVSALFPGTRPHELRARMREMADLGR